MADDALIAGAAAPRSRRLIGSTAILDALWVVAAGALFVVSSRFALVDIPGQYLRTGDAPLRGWTIALPAGAVVIALVAAMARSTALAAAATGILAPSVAFTGSLSSALFLDADSAFADAGLTVSLAAAFVGSVVLIRWFVYHPADLIGDESRPVRPASLAVVASGALNLGAIVVAAVVDDGAWTASFVFETVVMCTVGFVLIGAGVVRTRPAMVLAAMAAAAQIVGLVVVQLEAPALALDSRLVLRSGVVGAIAMAAAFAASVVGWLRHDVDPVVEGDDDADWRWTAPD